MIFSTVTLGMSEQPGRRKIAPENQKAINYSRYALNNILRLKYYPFHPIDIIESREDIMIGMLRASVLLAALILISSTSFAEGNNPLGIQMIDYSYVCNVAADLQPSPGKSFELNISEPIIKNKQVESIKMKSELNQRNKVLYSHTENPSDYMHAVQQGYVPW
jgi:tetrahydromethanopterin S-methyltransferase subunit F